MVTRLPYDTRVSLNRDWNTNTVSLVVGDQAVKMPIYKLAFLMLECNRMLAGTGYDWDDREMRRKLEKEYGNFRENTGREP
jgi:hypothetical protein